MNRIHPFFLKVSPDAIDANGHANNVEYIRWMQQAAIAHAETVGIARATLRAEASWFIRSHHIEYLRPAFLGEDLTVLTWIADLQKVSSLRKYLFVRKGEKAPIARGETRWVFVDIKTGRPKAIPLEVASTLPVLSSGEEPVEG